MQKISKILRETKIPKVTGYLIKFDEDGELEGKCAMGVLACESGVPSLKLSKEKIRVDWTVILQAYGIEDEKYPLLDHEMGVTGRDVWDFEDQIYLLSYIIVRLNDTYNFSFKEIAEFLETTFDL